MPSKYKTHHMSTERTFMMVKPDGVMRGLIGEVIKRVEQRGLKIVAIKMMTADAKHIDDFYPKTDAWITRLGEKALSTFTEYNIDPVECLGTKDPKKIGQSVRESILVYMTTGPVVPMVVEGVHAVSVIRKIIGSTLPIFAEPGTIRGDFAHDAPTCANVEGRSIINIVHASETPEEAAHEIAHWFAESEIQDYDRADHVIMFGDKRNS